MEPKGTHMHKCNQKEHKCINASKKVHKCVNGAKMYTNIWMEPKSTLIYKWIKKVHKHTEGTQIVHKYTKNIKKVHKCLRKLHIWIFSQIFRFLHKNRRKNPQIELISINKQKSDFCPSVISLSFWLSKRVFRARSLTIFIQWDWKEAAAAAKRNELGWGIKTHTILARGHRDDALAKQRRFGGKGKRQQKNPL